MINIVKNSKYQNYELEVQELRSMAIDYINYLYGSDKQINYEEKNKRIEMYYAKLFVIEEKIKSKKSIGNNLSVVSDEVKLTLDSISDLDEDRGIGLKLKL